MFDRKDVVVSDTIALGCSHTYGIGVKESETWSYLLNACNFGQPGCSADFIVRMAPGIINELLPITIYVLWPDWSRFEINENNTIKQSLPTDSNRINYMKTHNEDWLKNNFKSQTDQLRQLCEEKNIQLIEMTLYNLIPYIDHADRWPVSDLGHHYSPVWHRWVADIFNNLKETNTVLELAYE